MTKVVLRSAARRTEDVSELPLAIYTRLSRVRKPTKKQQKKIQKKPGRQWQTISVERQERICREWAQANKVALWDGKVFKDNNLSAWKPDRKRPDWDALQVLLRSGQIGGVLVFDADRFCRRNFDLEVFLALCDRYTGMRLASPTASYELDSPDAQDMLRMRIQMANREVVQIRKRVMVVLEENAREGIPPSAGTRPFGFIDALSNDQVPAEAEIIRECTGRLLGGESLQDVTLDLVSRDVRTVNGHLFAPTSLKHTLAKPRNAGIVMWHGEEVATMDGDPILPPEQWRDLVALFESRRRGRRPEGVNPLVGVVYCGRCERRMSGERLGKSGFGRRIYRCKVRKGDFHYQGCMVTIDAEHLEDDAAQAVIAWMCDPARAAGIAELSARTNQEQADALKALNTAKNALADLYERSALGEIPDDVFTTNRDRLTRIINTKQKTLDAVQAPEHVAALTENDARRTWATADGLQRRDLAKAAIKSLTVAAHPKGKGTARAFSPERITYTFN